MESSEQKPTINLPLFNGEPFERLVAILIAVVALVAAIAAFLEAHAGSASDRFERDAQQYGLQAVGLRTRGEVQVGYALSDAYRLWLELDTSAFSAEENEDFASATRFKSLRDEVEQLSPLLQAPYFDANAGTLPDINAFESNLYLVESTALSERFANAANVSDAWAAKANAYVSHLTLLTVTLFLFGLSTTVIGRMGWLFVGMGSLIATITIGWMSWIVLTPIPNLPDEAIVAYASGVGWSHQDRFDLAQQSFDQAIEFAPEYANAYYERAKVAFANENYAASVADYQAAADNGREDVNVPWNMGWAYYLMGDLDNAIATTESALEMAPEQLVLHYNLGLAQLATGNIEAAESAYATGEALAAQVVSDARNAGEEPPATLWWYLGATSLDLDHLVACLTDKICEGAPPFEFLTTSADVLAAATAQQRDAKQRSLALEYGLPEASGAVASVTPIEFAEAVYDDSGQIAGYVPLSNQFGLRGAGVFEGEGELDNVDITRPDSSAAGEVFITFDYAGMSDGQLVVAKVYVDGRESPDLRLVEEWQLGNSGQAVLPITSGNTFSLKPGEYNVELYVDANLIQQGSFTVGLQ